MSNVIGYIKIGDIKGESKDEKHKEWIELTMVNQALGRHIDPATKGYKALNTQVQIGGIDIQKIADASSPDLIAAGCAGKVFDEVKIDFVMQAKDGHDAFYEITLSDAFVSNYSLHGVNSGSVEMTETLTLNFKTIKWSYKMVDSKGKQQAPKEAGWDIEANKQI